MKKAKIKETSAGPELWIGNVLVRSWLGTGHNKDARKLASRINNQEGN